MLKKILTKTAIITTVVLTLLLIPSCYVSQEAVDTKDLSYIYNPVKNIFTPYFSVFNQDSETTVVSIRLARNELYFNEANPLGVPMASIYVSVKLYDNVMGGSLADTASSKYEIRKDQVPGEFICRLPLKTYAGKSYSAEIKIIDLIRQRTFQSFIDFEKAGPDDRMNFKVVDYFSHNELFSNVLKNGQYINLLYPQEQIDTIWVLYYPALTAVPPAPSEILPEVTPSDEPLRSIPLAYSDTTPIMFPREGIYLLTLDSLSRHGIALFNFGEDHPTMDSPSTMIPPLTYIATREEMDSMMNAEKQKLALDAFWLKRTGSIERSKELIRIYYNRTLYANYYFSSYKPGWLTDRGMIYIMYGPPDKLYKNADGESWGYKKPKEKSRWGARFTVEDTYLWFNFAKKKSIFSDNNYTLNRALTPVSYWDVAVARWREGKVFSLDNPVELK